MVSRSPAQTARTGNRLAATLRVGDIVLLYGDLGTGKTVLARGIATGLGVPATEVRSPSFTFLNPYRGRMPVYHIDLYRVNRPADLDELGLEEVLGGDGVALVEWPERLGVYRPRGCVEITLTDRGGTRREIRIEDCRGGGHAGVRGARHSRR